MKSKVGKALGWLLLIGIAVFLVVKYQNAKYAAQWSADFEKQAEANAQREVDNLFKNHWYVKTSTDAMTDKEVVIASLLSQNIVNFGFPYEGGSSLTINIRKKNNDIDVYFTISKGQFVCSEYSGTDTMLIRFDDEEPVKYKMSESATNDSDILFIRYSSAENTFLSKCKSAHSIKVQANFFEEGSKVFEFKVEEPLSAI